jgi:hypothetical protein
LRCSVVGETKKSSLHDKSIKNKHIMPPKKLLPKPKPVATPKPLPEALPRYVAPPRPSEVGQGPAITEPNDWLLAFSFWWAMFWRTFLVVIPSTLLVQLCIMILFSATNPTPEPTPLQAGITLVITLALSVLLQVAIVRHMVRKKTFRGFTISLKKR